MHSRAEYTLAYVSALPQRLRGEEILDGGGGRGKKFLSLRSFFFSLFFCPFPQKRLILRLGIHY